MIKLKIRLVFTVVMCVYARIVRFKKNVFYPFYAVDSIPSLRITGSLDFVHRPEF
jgi:hypothetical protein